MLRIYLVEDNRVIRENLAETLVELVGAKVVGSSGMAMAATSWLATHMQDWDVAIVDLFLLQGRGMQVVSALRPRHPTQKVFVLSNYVSPEVRAECARLGADKVFDKTTEIDALIQTCKLFASTCD